MSTTTRLALLAGLLAGCITRLDFGASRSYGDLQVSLERRERDMWSSDAGGRRAGPWKGPGLAGREIYGVLRLDCGAGRTVEEEIHPLDFALGGRKEIECGPRQVIVHRLLGSGVELDVRR